MKLLRYIAISPLLAGALLSLVIGLVCFEAAAFIHRWLGGLEDG